MQTQEDLRREFDRLMDLDRLEEASAVLDQIDPISEEELLDVIRNAPEVDESLPDAIRQRIDAFRSVEGAGRRAG